MRTAYKPTAVALAAFVSSGAHALTTYELTFDGTQTHFLDQWECGGPLAPPCDPFMVTTPWTGTLTVIAPDGDGTFTQFRDGMTLLLNDSASAFSDVFSTVAMAVLDGVVTGFSGQTDLAFVPWPVYGFQDGMTIWFEQAHQHAGETRGSAPLIAVPEPESWALLLSGLIGIGASTRKRPVERAQALVG